ncbi:hypothetical protein Nepgr_029504 [Nepenthes gracilis]|uniref:protein-serine/threonine phosphatase n=1 Tax=Nepenthes gracilis TaxID=150966 RepID=A0AAD3Y5L6_NEPGR|nr:hypothetical protein Nepgr_029504 [Nepenthes gracilis]
MTCNSAMPSPAPKSNLGEENHSPTPILSQFRVPIKPKNSSQMLQLRTVDSIQRHPSPPSSESVVTPPSKSALSCSLKRKRPPKIQIPDALREIKIDAQFKSGGSWSTDDFVCFGDLGVGVSSVKGKKRFMEDVHKIVPSLHGNLEKGFMGVYDGHGGRKAAEFVAENLHNNIMQMFENRTGSMSKDEAIKAGYLKTDQDFLKLGVGSGACCVTALIEGNEIFISNLGDCRAVLCRGGVAEALTTDHRAERDDERKRIEDKGGYVEIHRGAWRVHGILSVSRSIGDAHLKDWVIAEPDTTILNLTPDMEFLILASDGLWEEVGNQEAAEIVQKSYFSSKKLLPLAEDDLSKENINEYACVSSSCSPKARRISLVKQQQQKMTSLLSPRFTKTVKEDLCDDEFDSENENHQPPLKLRRLSLFQQQLPKKKSKRVQSPSEENKRQLLLPSSGRGLVAACKELVKLALSRGGLDDITVMIIDLSNHFRE